jgi:4-hydroxybenzoate polyprenyltransferase
LARLFHLVMMALLAGVYSVMTLGGFFLLGILITAAMLLYEHWLLRGGDLQKLDAAFFNMNGYISVVILFCTAADVFTRSL